MSKIKNILFTISLLPILFLLSCSEEETATDTNYIKVSSGTFSLATRMTEVTSYHDSTVIDSYKTKDFAITDYGEQYYQIDTIKLTDTKISLIADDKTLDGERYDKIFNNLDYEQVGSVLSFNYSIDSSEFLSWFQVDGENEIRAIQGLVVLTTKDSLYVDEIISTQVGELTNFTRSIVTFLEPVYYTHYSTTFYYSKE